MPLTATRPLMILALVAASTAKLRPHEALAYALPWPSSAVMKTGRKTERIMQTAFSATGCTCLRSAAYRQGVPQWDGGRYALRCNN